MRLWVPPDLTGFDFVEFGGQASIQRQPHKGDQEHEKPEDFIRHAKIPASQATHDVKRPPHTIEQDQECKN